VNAGFFAAQQPPPSVRKRLYELGYLCAQGLGTIGLCASFPDSSLQVFATCFPEAS
jgi:hypothetical protein